MLQNASNDIIELQSLGPLNRETFKTEKQNEDQESIVSHSRPMQITLHTFIIMRIACANCSKNVKIPEEKPTRCCSFSSLSRKPKERQLWSTFLLLVPAIAENKILANNRKNTVTDNE